MKILKISDHQQGGLAFIGAILILPALLVVADFDVQKLRVFVSEFEDFDSGFALSFWQASTGAFFFGRRFPAGI